MQRWRIYLMASLLVALNPHLLLAADTQEAPPERPKIGLALSGGGARGGAHIGVLKALEELHIPIDYIAGTSMGAIIGGFYAAGYNAEEIEQIVAETDWMDAFSDQADRSGMTMRKKELDASFLIPHRVGFNKGKIQLPLGVIEGQKLDQIFKRVLRPVQDDDDFNDLRIPFRAVATDLVTGEEVVMRSGSLAQAVRASMSIPGVFAPVVRRDRMLVDGGMANNLPISVVRDMGADIVIAVDISSPLLTRKQIDSVLAVSEQLTNFLTRRNTEAQLATLGPEDVLVLPVLVDVTSTDFKRVLDLVPVGYDAVMEHHERLAQLTTSVQGPQEPIPGMEEPSDYVVQFVNIDNASVLNDDIIRSRLAVTEGEVLDIPALEQSINHIYSLDVFQSVTYDLVRNEAGETGIEVNAVPRAWGPNYLQFGLEISDDFSGNTDFSVGAAYTRNALNSLGGEMRVEVAIGREDKIQFDFYQPIDKIARWFVEPRLYWKREVLNIFEEDTFISQIEVSGPGATVGIGRNFSSTELVRLDYSYLEGDADVVIGDPGLLIEDNVDIGELVLHYRHDSLDDLWFPRTGSLIAGNYRVAREELGAASDYDQAYAAGVWAYTYGKNSGQLSVQGGYSFDDDAPYERWFELGGFGRLSGLVPDQLAGRNVALASLALYRRLNDVEVFPVYAGFTLEAGNVWVLESDIGFDSLRYSGSIFVGANTPIGPLYLAYGLSDNDDSAIYFYLGNPWRTGRF